MIRQHDHPRSPRPWYCPDHVVDEYKTTLIEETDRLPMIKSLKIIRAIIVNLGLLGLGGFAIARGGDPTLLGFTVLAVFGAYNSLEIGDYLALVRAYNEIQDGSTDDDGE